MDGHQRTQITFGIFIWIIVSGETLTWIVLDGSNIFDIGRIFTFARYPNGVQLEMCPNKLAKLSCIKMHSINTHFHWIGFVDFLNQLTRHFWRQIFCAIIEFRYPTVNFVQFQENARRTLVIAVVILLCAFLETLDVDIANLAGWRWLIVFAIENVLTTSSC